MREWREPEWRNPRKGDVVRDPDGNLGLVIRTEGDMIRRSLWVEDYKGTLCHTDENPEIFSVLTTTKEVSDFHHKRYNHKGYHVGALCSFRGNLDVPLEILQMDWGELRYKMSFCLKDHRQFESEIMLTDDESRIPLFEMDFPPIEAVFSKYDSGLPYRLEIGLVESGNTGWTNCGSPWEFDSREEALQEVENWKSRLKIRRLASVLNADWKIQFPCWTVEARKKDDKIQTRVKEVHSYDGSPGYFKNALTAAQATKMLQPEIWLSALSGSQDTLNL